MEIEFTNAPWQNTASASCSTDKACHTATHCYKPPLHQKSQKMIYGAQLSEVYLTTNSQVWVQTGFQIIPQTLVWSEPPQQDRLQKMALVSVYVDTDWLDDDFLNISWIFPL